MKDSFAKKRGNDIFRSQTRVVEGRLVGVDRRTRGVLDNNRLRYQVGDTPELAFIFSELRFCLLERLDISACSIPPENLASVVS